MNRWFALAYVAGTGAAYLMLSALAGLDLRLYAPPYVFVWWRPALAAFVGAAAVIPPAIYLGSRTPPKCVDCERSAKRLAKVERERDQLRRALEAVPVDQLTERS